MGRWPQCRCAGFLTACASGKWPNVSASTWWATAPRKRGFCWSAAALSFLSSWRLAGCGAICAPGSDLGLPTSARQYRADKQCTPDSDSRKQCSLLHRAGCSFCRGCTILRRDAAELSWYASTSRASVGGFIRTGTGHDRLRAGIVSCLANHRRFATDGG